MNKIVAIYAKNNFLLIIKNEIKKRYHCHFTNKYRGATHAHNVCNLRYKMPKEISVVFHNGSKYDYYFMIKELAKEFKEQFECPGKNTKKHITFSGTINEES